MEVDLLCAQSRIAIELDGSQHLSEADAYRRDRRKDALLQETGYQILRFLAEDVGQYLDQVPDAILRRYHIKTPEPDGYASDSYNFEAGKCRLIEAVVEGEKAVAFPHGVGADDEVGEEAARSWFALPSAPSGVSLGRLPGGAPRRLIQIPVDRDARVSAKHIKEGFIPTGTDHQLGEDRRGDDQAAASQCCIQG
jgi:hypothetical protein